MKAVSLGSNRISCRFHHAMVIALIWGLGGMAATLGNEPDLIVADVDATDVLTDCQSLDAIGDLRATVKNVGSVETSSGFAVSFFRDDGDGLLDGDDEFLGNSIVIAPLGPEEESQVSIFIDTPLLFVGNLLFAFADSADDVAESEEGNNTGHSGMRCGAPWLGGFSMVEKWNWSTPVDWPEHHQVMMTPVVVNLTDDNGDGLVNEKDTPDVVFSTFANGAYFKDSIIRAVNGKDGSIIFSTPLTPDLDVMGEGSIAVGDIDGDGLPEIIANEDLSDAGYHRNTHGRLIVFEHDGTFKFKSDLMEDGKLRWGGASIANLNEVGPPEIVVGRHVFDNEGQLLAMGTSRKGDNGEGPLAVCADIDRDGWLDIVAGFTVYEVEMDDDLLSRPITGLTVKWEATDENGDVVEGEGFPGVADFDGDEFGEVLVVSKGEVWLFDEDGSFLWRSTIPCGAPDCEPAETSNRGGAPNIDDFDGDGEVEVGVAGRYRYALFDTDGALIWERETWDDSSHVTASSSFDFDCDGAAEVVYKDQEYLRIYRGTNGNTLAEVETGSRTTYEMPVIADVDGDGHGEIIIGANDYDYGNRRGILVFGQGPEGWPGARGIWNQHCYSITNVDDDGTIPVDEKPHWSIYNRFRGQEALGPLDCGRLPDLTASWIRIDEAYCPDYTAIVARVGNGGGAPAPAPVWVSFYDGDPDMGGQLLGFEKTTSDLEPGFFEDVTLVVAPALEGFHMLCVVADAGGSGARLNEECDEENNRCCHPFDGFCNSPPVADAGGPYHEGCGRPPTMIQLDGTDSFDPDGDDLTYFWVSACPGALFDDPTSPTPLLFIDAPPPCPLWCSVELTVTDPYGESDTDKTLIVLSDS